MQDCCEERDSLGESRNSVCAQGEQQNCSSFYYAESLAARSAARAASAADAAATGIPALQRIHSAETYAADAEAASSVEYWRTQPTKKNVESLKPGKPRP